ncbi:MAG TPA: amino acid ABC transporter permease [Ramlibacter sp.]|uniref:amino acid ABC transporter permease n=1 Tax=Ramlibacter sp. TaxID=1917967 RepID=UPI002ED32D40
MNSFSLTHVGYLAVAAQWTLLLSLLAFGGGAVLGLALALGRVSQIAALRKMATAYIQVVQGTPLLVLLFLSYFGISIAGLNVPPLLAAAFSLTLYTGAFLGEIWRGCIEAVARTQWEAAECLGMNRFGQYVHVILPQAARIAIAPTVGFMVQVVKNTSLASIIGFLELSRAGQVVNNSTFQPFTVFAVVAVMYFALCYPLSLASRHFERKLHVGRQ